MPFTSKKQWRAAFAGKIPGVNPHEWAHETRSFKNLPERAASQKGKPTLRSKGAAREHEEDGPGNDRAIAISGLLGAGAQFANHGYGVGGNWVQGSQGWRGEGSAGIGALLSGPGHNRGRRALGAAVGDALGARMGGLAGALTGAVAGNSREAMAVGALVGQSVGKAMGGIAGNKLVDDMTKHEREPGYKEAGMFEALESELAEIFKVAALGDAVRGFGAIAKERLKQQRGKEPLNDLAVNLAKKMTSSQPAGAGHVLGARGYQGAKNKFAALGTSAMNPGNVGRLKGMMTTHALKAPGYAASTQAVNPRKNVVSAMNAMKPH